MKNDLNYRKAWQFDFAIWPRSASCNCNRQKLSGNAEMEDLTISATGSGFCAFRLLAFFYGHKAIWAVTGLGHWTKTCGRMVQWLERRQRELILKMWYSKITREMVFELGFLLSIKKHFLNTKKKRFILYFQKYTGRKVSGLTHLWPQFSGTQFVQIVERKF